MAERGSRGLTPGRLEMHEHHYISGPLANSFRSKFEHSHEGGDVPHVHKDAVHSTGPGAYTIDKDEWFARTGLKGGGRKRFTGEPSGPQLPLVRVEAPSIRVHIVGDGGASAANGAAGAGDLPIHRMQLAMKAQVVSVTHDPLSRRRAR